MPGYARALMEINAQALQHNVAILRQHARPARMIAILKANAYGHGLLSTAWALQKMTDGFGVALLSEAMQLREAGITHKILVLEGALAIEEYAIAYKEEIDMVIHHESQYQWLMQHPPLHPITIWLKVNTGMNRLGMLPNIVHSLIQQLNASPFIKSIVLMSHLASADQLNNPANITQCRVFDKLIQAQTHPALTYSLANSAGVLAWPDTHYHWVRPGLALYGVSPFTHHDGQHYDLRPVMTLKAKIIAIQQLQPGDAIGYYGLVHCQMPMRIGIVAFGYGDGYPYDAPEGTPVLFREQRVRLIGQVSMDMMTIDLSGQATIRLGEEVTLWGVGLSVEEIARWTRRSCYELLCGVQRSTCPRLHIKVI
jgi:alanine racemase